MKEINKMRLGVLRELKNVRKFFDHMESSVKTRNPEAIQKAFLFLANLVYHMDKGCLTPTNIALDVELCKEMNNVSRETSNPSNLINAAMNSGHMT